MLVLSRMVGESIVIGAEGVVLGGPVRVSVVRILGDKVRLGIEADEGVRIDRQEVFDRIQSGEERRK
jgi:carbon storage regulator CsrA